MALPLLASPWQCDAGWPDSSQGSGSGYSLADAPAVACWVLRAAQRDSLQVGGAVGHKCLDAPARSQLAVHAIVHAANEQWLNR